MIRSIKGGLVGLAPLGVLLASPSALAQGAPPGAPVQGQVQVAPPAPPPPPAPAPPPPPGGSDHDMFIGRVGIGWYGTKPVPVGPDTIQTNVVGARYWVTPMIGIDGGLGLFTQSGSTNNQPQPPGTTFDNNSRTTFVLHAGVPLALGNTGHFSFQITPELDVGFGSGTNPAPPPGPNTDLSGFILRVGARAGAEIYFGFIGVPQLAIDASLGAFLTSTTQKATTGVASSKVSTLTINTDQFNQPWNIFTSNVSVRYYF